MAIVMKKSVNSQKVSIVLPSYNTSNVSNQIIIIIRIKDDNVYGAVIVASHFESSPGSYDEYGTAPSGRRLSAQSKRPGL